MERYLAQLDIVGRALILLQNNVLPIRGLALSEEWLGVRVARKVEGAGGEEGVGAEIFM